MSMLFGRPVESSDPLNLAVQNWETSRFRIFRALALNLRYDHRVSPAREALFRSYVAKCPTLQEALTQYHKKEVRRKPSPKSPPIFNEPGNFIADCSCPFGPNYVGFNKGLTMVNVYSLTSIADLLVRTIKDVNKAKWRLIRDIDVERDAEDNVIPDSFNHWLEEKLSGTLEEQKKVITAIFSVVNYNKDKYGPFNPQWATDWDKFESYAGLLAAESKRKVDKWNNSLGVRREGHWQIVLKYPASKVGCLYRPTQLDSGFYAEHFPSPTQTPLHLGGHPMDLSKGPVSRSGLLPEFIHEQIRLCLSYWEDAGCLIGRTAPVKHNLASLRKKHWRKLHHHYPNAHLNGMPKAI